MWSPPSTKAVEKPKTLTEQRAALKLEALARAERLEGIARCLRQTYGMIPLTTVVTDTVALLRDLAEHMR